MHPQKTDEDGHDRSPTGRGIGFHGASEDQVAALAGEQDAHLGVIKVEAALRIYGRYSRWCLFIGRVRFLIPLLETRWRLSSPCSHDARAHLTCLYVF